VQPLRAVPCRASAGPVPCRAVPCLRVRAAFAPSLSPDQRSLRFPSTSPTQLNGAWAVRRWTAPTGGARACVRACVRTESVLEHTRTVNEVDWQSA
jgi:hypothetical protein